MRLPIYFFIIYLLILKSILQPSHEKEKSISQTLWQLSLVIRLSYCQSLASKSIVCYFQACLHSPHHISDSLCSFLFLYLVKTSTVMLGL